MKVVVGNALDEQKFGESELKFFGLQYEVRDGKFVFTEEVAEAAKSRLAKWDEAEGLELVQKIRASIKDKLERKQFVKHIRLAVEPFVRDNGSDKAVWFALTQIVEDGVLAEKAGELFRLLPVYAEWKRNVPFVKSLRKKSLAAQIVTEVMDQGVLPIKTVKKYGKVHEVISFGGTRLKNVLSGVLLTPDYEPPRYYNRGRLGEVKYNKEEKELLRLSAHTAFRVRKVDEETLDKWFLRNKNYVSHKKEVDRLAKEKRNVEDKIAVLKQKDLTPKIRKKLGVLAAKEKSLFYKLREAKKLFLLHREYWKDAKKVIFFLMKLDRVYLPMKNDSRWRLYYIFNLLGINPMGEEFEAAMWEYADEYVPSEGFETELVWDLSVLMGFKVKKFAAHIWWKKNRKVIRAKVRRLGRVREPYMNQLLDLIDAAEKQKPTNIIWKRDANNSGGQLMAAGFKSDKMATTVDIVAGGKKELSSLHTTMAEAVGIERKLLKELVNNPIQHGGSIAAGAKKLQAVGVEITPEGLEDMMLKAAGPVLLNPSKIAHWGSQIRSSVNPVLRWKRPDGVRAQSIGVITGAPSDIQPMSNRLGQTPITVYSDMPFARKLNGRPIIDGLKGSSYKVLNLYADLVHSMDSLNVAEFIRRGVPVLFKHDDFGLRATNESLDLLREVAEGTLYSVMKLDLFGDFMRQIAENYAGECDAPPALFYGEKEIPFDMEYAYTA